MSAQITHDLFLRVGSQKGEDGKMHHEYLQLGHVVEENFGQGNTRELLKIHAALLSPTLYAQLKPHLGGSAYAYIERKRRDRRAPNRGTPPPEPAPQQAQAQAQIETEEPWIDPDNP
jgi:hypothetical protein